MSSISCGAAEESSPGREPGVRRSSRASSGGAADAFLSPFQGSESLKAIPTAHAVGYCLPVLRTCAEASSAPLLRQPALAGLGEVDEVLDLGELGQVGFETM